MESNSQKGSTTTIVIGLIVAIIIAGLAYVFVVSPKKGQTVAESPVVATPETTGGATSTPVTPAPTASTNIYKDGTYTAIGNYNSPGGAETIKITLTIKNDVITDAVAVPQATRPNSVVFQRQFAAGFKALVVGKNINTVSLDKVSGSSLTPQGFNDAVAKIKVQAKA